MFYSNFLNTSCFDVSNDLGVRGWSRELGCVGRCGQRQVNGEQRKTPGTPGGRVKNWQRNRLDKNRQTNT